jgi:hypothetical protein
MYKTLWKSVKRLKVYSYKWIAIWLLNKVAVKNVEMANKMSEQISV